MGETYPNVLYKKSATDDSQRWADGRILFLLAKVTHCRHGHEYTDKNTGFDRTARARYCRRCRADQAARKRARKKLGTTGREHTGSGLLVNHKPKIG